MAEPNVAGLSHADFVLAFGDIGLGNPVARAFAAVDTKLLLLHEGAAQDSNEESILLHLGSGASGLELFLLRSVVLRRIVSGLMQVTMLVRQEDERVAAGEEPHGLSPTHLRFGDPHPALGGKVFRDHATLGEAYLERLTAEEKVLADEVGRLQLEGLEHLEHLAASLPAVRSPRDLQLLERDFSVERLLLFFQKHDDEVHRLSGLLAEARRELQRHDAMHIWAHFERLIESPHMQQCLCDPMGAGHAHLPADVWHPERLGHSPGLHQSLATEPTLLPPLPTWLRRQFHGVRDFALDVAQYARELAQDQAVMNLQAGRVLWRHVGAPVRAPPTWRNLLPTQIDG